MNTSSHDFVTVDMRRLKAALVARARGDRVNVSVLVRAAVARHLDLSEAAASGQGATLASPPTDSTIVKLSIRLTVTEAAQLASGARAAGLSRGAYLAGLIANVPVLSMGANRTEQLATLIAFNAELPALCRDIRHLTALLRQGEVQAAREYRAMLDTLADDIRSHLKAASSLLADLRPRRSSAGLAKHPST